MPYIVQKSSCEVAVFLCGICLFIFFAGLAIYIYFHYSSTSYEKSIINHLIFIDKQATNFIAMILHKNWVINSIFSALIVLTCYIGDTKLSSFNEKQILKALYDNITHGLVGYFAAVILITDDWERMYWAFLCMLLSSAIDIDHFISARSFKLTDATNLQSRPFLHNSTIPLILLFLLIYCHLSYQNNDVIMILIILVIAFTTHHLRDAYRRGLTFIPFYQTPPLPYYLYIGLILITPYLLKFFVIKDVRYRKIIASNASELIFEV